MELDSNNAIALVENNETSPWNLFFFFCIKYGDIRSRRPLMFASSLYEC